MVCLLGSFLNTLSHLLFKRSNCMLLCAVHFLDMKGMHKLKWRSLTNHLMFGEMQIKSLMAEVAIK